MTSNRSYRLFRSVALERDAAPSPSSLLTGFRSDINAMRALAVVVVILFHFGVPGFSGGFVGVDVFFVISGYLMTQIVTTRQARGSFSLLDFYMARFRRIAPALLAVAALLMTAGWFLLLPDEFGRLAGHVASSVLFVSNILFWREDGYFDQASLEKWLLHTWSLSVEWQFYLLFPLLIIICRRYLPPAWLRRIFWIVALLSLLVSYQVTRINPSAAFYLLPTRAWEFLLGGLVYLHADWLRGKIRPWHGFFGVGVVVVCSVLYSEALAYPSLWPLLPTIGAALAIAARPGGRVIEHPVTQALGTTSYSLYLWHWPVLLSANRFGLDPTPLTVLGMGGVTCILAGVSYRFIETPFRTGFSLGRFAVRGRAVFGASFVLLLLAVLTVKAEGVPQRLPSDVVAIANEASNTNPLRETCYSPSRSHSFPECRLGSHLAPDAVLWGDSHSDAAFTGFAEAMGQVGRSAVYYGLSGCAPALSIGAPDRDPHAERCSRYNSEVLSRLLARPELRDIVLVGRWPAEKYHNAQYDFAGLICTLRQSGKRVFVMTTVPTYDVDIPKTAARMRLSGSSLSVIEAKLTRPIAEYQRLDGPTNALLAEAADACGAVLLDPFPHFCGNESCVPLESGLPLYFDNGHLNERGARRLTPLFVEALRN